MSAYGKSIRENMRVYCIELFNHDFRSLNCYRRYVEHMSDMIRVKRRLSGILRCKENT